jgi:SAM-dependent methyltransferase
MAFYTNPLNSETYDLGVGRGGPERSDIPFYVDLVRSVGNRVLELGCGTGQVTIALAEAGFEVTGLDLSPLMLDVAQEKSAALDLAIRGRLRFVQGDMAAFELESDFDAVIIPFRSFQFLLTSDAQRACLTRIRNHLRPGGVFAAQLFDPILDMCIPGYEAGGSDSKVDPASGRTIYVERVRHPNDTVRQVLHETWSFTEIDADGTLIREAAEELVLRWTYRYEMRYLIELAGLEVIGEYSDFDASPPAYGREQVWVARRPN